MITFLVKAKLLKDRFTYDELHSFTIFDLRDNLSAQRQVSYYCLETVFFAQTHL